MDLKHFTAIGATTRQGLISAPLRGRFGLVLRLNPYDIDELARIVQRSARLLERSKWTPPAPKKSRGAAGGRRASPTACCGACGIMRRCAPTDTSTHDVARRALDLLEVDRFGLDEIDQKIMLTVLEKYGGGPVGLNTIAASIDEEPDTIEEVYEPYLIQLGFLDRTPRGRVATDRAFEYFKIPRRIRGAQNTLF